MLPLSYWCNSSCNSPCCGIQRMSTILCDQLCCLLGKHVDPSFWFSAFVYIYPLTSCSQPITPLPGKVNKGKNAKSQSASAHLYAVAHPAAHAYSETHYKWREREAVKEKKNPIHEKLVSFLLSSLSMYRDFYSLSSMPPLLILSALSGSLGRVTG